MGGPVGFQSHVRGVMEELDEELGGELGVGQCAWEHSSWSFAKTVSLPFLIAQSHTGSSSSL